MTLRALQYSALSFIAAAALAGCVAAPDESATTRASAPPVPVNNKVAILVPLTGPNANLGRDLLQGVQLALGPNGPQPDVLDTKGTPSGATAAAQQAVAAGDGIIVGPLTAGETAAAAAVANGIPILAFTSDPQQGRPGVWALGITPQQQVLRLTQSLRRVNKSRIAAVLPDNIFGAALSDGLITAATAVADPAPVIRRYPDGRGPQLDAALRAVSEYASRHSADSAPPDPLVTPPDVAPPPFDALLLAAGGSALATVASALPGYGITPPDVQVIGPATWAHDPAAAGLSGAWYAGPDPSFRTRFEQAYTAKYGSAPSGLVDLAYDAGQLARVAAGNLLVITQTNGFRGVDGLFALRPDGHVVRGLAVFAVGPDGAHIVDPAPASLATGS